MNKIWDKETKLGQGDKETREDGTRDGGRENGTENWDGGTKSWTRRQGWDKETRDDGSLCF